MRFTIVRDDFNQAKHGLKGESPPNCERACVAHSDAAPLCHGEQGDGRKYESRKESHDAARRERPRDGSLLGGEVPAFIAFSGVSCCEEPRFIGSGFVAS